MGTESVEPLRGGQLSSSVAFAGCEDVIWAEHVREWPCRMALDNLSSSSVNAGPTAPSKARSYHCARHVTDDEQARAHLGCEGRTSVQASMVYQKRVMSQ